jgi:hypothetical protein
VEEVDEQEVKVSKAAGNSAKVVGCETAKSPILKRSPQLVVFCLAIVSI